MVSLLQEQLRTLSGNILDNIEKSKGSVASALKDIVAKLRVLDPTGTMTKTALESAFLRLNAAENCKFSKAAKKCAKDWAQDVRKDIRAELRRENNRKCSKNARDAAKEILDNTEHQQPLAKKPKQQLQVKKESSSCTKAPSGCIVAGYAGPTKAIIVGAPEGAMKLGGAAITRDFDEKTAPAEKTTLYEGTRPDPK